MKNALLIISLICTAIPFQIESCPSCLGRIEQESPPFFTDEFYTQTTQSADHLYQKLLAQQAKENKSESQKQEAS